MTSSYSLEIMCDRDASEKMERDAPLTSVDVRGGGRLRDDLKNVCVGG